MESQKKWSVLNTVKVQAVEPTGEIEGADEATLVCKQRSFYEINCLCVFFKMSQVEFILYTMQQNWRDYLLYDDRPPTLAKLYQHAMAMCLKGPKSLGDLFKKTC